MSNEIIVQYEAAMQAAGDLQNTSRGVIDHLDNMYQRLLNLSECFVGRAHDSFMEKLAEWKRASDEQLEVLVSLGQFLAGVINEFHELDRELASRFPAPG